MSETWPDYCMDCGAMGEPHESNCPVHEQMPDDWVVGDAMPDEQDAPAEPRKADKDCGVSRRDAVKRLHDELDEWPKLSEVGAMPIFEGWRWEGRAAKATLERRDASGFVEVITETDWRANYYPFKHADRMPHAWHVDWAKPSDEIKGPSISVAEMMQMFKHPFADGDPWAEGEKRIDAIGANGGEGLHYAEDSDSEAALSQAMREMNPATSSLTYGEAIFAAEITGLCADGKPCGTPPEDGSDAYCVDCPNRNAVVTDFPKQPRYQDKTGDDWIDEFARTATAEEFRGAMRFTVGKYNRRAGKKDELTSEIRKMRDYCDRWLAYEEGDA